MTTSNDLDTVSHSWDEHSQHNGLPSQAQMQVAEASPAQKAAPAAAEPVPVDVGNGTPVKPEAPAEAKAPAAAAPHEYVADANHVVKLPANVSIDNIKVDGHNLVLEQADGSVIVIKDGALNVPTFIIGDVEVPRVALIAALEASHVDVAFGADGSISAGAAGSPSSAGGDFSIPPGGIGDGFGLSALLPPTDLAFGQPDHRELFPSLVDRPVSVVATSLLTPDQAASETGLNGGPSQSPGSNAASSAETSGVGSISVNAPDGVGSIVINGVAVTAAGQQIPGQFGYITILSFDPNTGHIDYDYTVTHSVTHPDQTTGFDPSDTVPDNFSVTVTDVDGDSASTTFAVAIIDDVPTAVADTDSVTEGGTVNGNVIAGLGSDGNPAGADTKGADGASVSGVTGAGATTVVGGEFHVVGQYGTLTLSADGTYSYVANANISNASPVTDTFTYTLKDGDGDTSQTTLNITISDGVDPSVLTNAIITVDEAGLGTVNATGSAAATNVEDGSGTVSFHAGSDNITGMAFTSVAGITADVNGVAGADIVWTLVGPTQITGSINGVDAIHIDLVASSLPILAGTDGFATVNVTLLDNFPHPDAGGQNVINLTGINVVATDTDGSQASATVQVNVDDDIPVAVNDGQSATEGGAAIVANAANGVLANDHVGADQPGTVTAVTGGTVGNPIATAYGTLTLNSDGSYVYTPKASVPDGTVDSFTYTMKDADGDTSQAVLSFTFSGDSNHATAGVSATLVDEDDLATGNHDTALGDDTPSAQPGTLTHNYGADGAGHIALVSGSETVNGTTYTYTANGAGTQIIASAGGVNVFQVDLTNAVTGTYTVTLLSPVQHPIAGTEDNLAFNLSYKVYDADDTAATAATGTLTVTVDDDIPVAVNDGQSATEGGAAIVANAANGVLANDHVGADQPGTVTAVTGGTVGNPIATAYGTLTLNSDGSYVYTPKASVPDGTVDSFTYTMKDADGDTSQAVLSFTFSGDSNHATAGVSATLVDEDDLATGNHDTALGDDTPSAQPGTLTHNYGADGAGHIALVSGSETVNGTTYTYTANGAGTQIIASAGGVNVFQVDLTNAVTGTYTVTLLSPVQHPIAGTEDNLAFNLSYKVYDADDTAATAATGTLTVTVDDDIPVA
ncbi:Ig-like domain-containing protein, partial [Mesorhizobium sp. WSM4311]|uniref:beta strand repeat-containing protein n=2 Tax=unclassified Mesorhizobium TaxID=325217 RepID=UPI000BD085EA